MPFIMGLESGDPEAIVVLLQINTYKLTLDQMNGRNC